MATDLDLITSSLKQYVVSPLNAFGLGGFVFDVEGETTLTLSADATDHFVEDNGTMQDHIAIKPKILVLKRYVGEVVYQQDDTVVKQIQKVTQKLTAVSGFLPSLSKAAQQIRSIKLSDVTASNLLNTAKNASVNQLTDYWALARNLTGMNSKQQQAFMYLKALYEAKALVSVQTPYEFLSNMAILNVVATQGEGERYVSDFSITLKQMRFGKTSTVPASTVPENRARDSAVKPAESLAPVPTPKLQERAALQSETLKNNGNVPGTPVGIPKTRKEWTDRGLLPPPENM